MATRRFEKELAAIASVTSVTVALVAGYVGMDYIGDRFVEARDLKWVVALLLWVLAVCITAAYPCVHFLEMTKLGAWLDRQKHK